MVGGVVEDVLEMLVAPSGLPLHTNVVHDEPGAPRGGLENGDVAAGLVDESPEVVQKALGNTNCGKGRGAE